MRLEESDFALNSTLPANTILSFVEFGFTSGLCHNVPPNMYKYPASGIIIIESVCSSSPLSFKKISFPSFPSQLFGTST